MCHFQITYIMMYEISMLYQDWLLMINRCHSWILRPSLQENAVSLLLSEVFSSVGVHSIGLPCLSYLSHCPSQFSLLTPFPLPALQKQIFLKVMAHNCLFLIHCLLQIKCFPKLQLQPFCRAFSKPNFGCDFSSEFHSCMLKFPLNSYIRHTNITPVNTTQTQCFIFCSFHLSLNNIQQILLFCIFYGFLLSSQLEKLRTLEMLLTFTFYYVMSNFSTSTLICGSFLSPCATSLYQMYMHSYSQTVAS